MDKKVLSFLEKHRISNLTVILPDGTPHSAPLHFASTEDGLNYYFMTKKDSKKMQALENNKPSKASLVIGFSEEEFVTIQMSGEAKKLTSENEIEEAYKAYGRKYQGADSEESRKDTEHLFILFKPTWWRYTEFRPKPYTIISSDNE